MCKSGSACGCGGVRGGWAAMLLKGGAAVAGVLAVVAFIADHPWLVAAAVAVAAVAAAALGVAARRSAALAVAYWPSRVLVPPAAARPVRALPAAPLAIEPTRVIPAAVVLSVPASGPAVTAPREA